MARLLLQNGAKTEVDETIEATRSALYMALRRRQYEIAKVLLEFGANTNLSSLTLDYPGGKHYKIFMKDLLKNDRQALDLIKKYEKK